MSYNETLKEKILNVIDELNSDVDGRFFSSDEMNAIRLAALREGYENGLTDAWKAARKLYRRNYKTEKQFCEDIFGTDYYDTINHLNPQEAIDAISRYERGDTTSEKHTFQVGDVVDYGRAIITRVEPFHIYVLFDDGSCGEHGINEFEWTGRHYDSIADFIRERDI